MSDSCKRILSPFTGCKKRKAWNNTREKYMPVKRRQNLAETDIGSFYKEEQLEEFFDSKSAFYNVNKSDNHDDSYNESNGQQELPEGFANSCYKIVTPILLQKLINDFAICKHQKHCRLVFSWFFDIPGNLGIVKEKPSRIFIFPLVH